MAWRVQSMSPSSCPPLLHSCLRDPESLDLWWEHTVTARSRCWFGELPPRTDGMSRAPSQHELPASSSIESCTSSLRSKSPPKLNICMWEFRDGKNFSFEYKLGFSLDCCQSASYFSLDCADRKYMLGSQGMRSFRIIQLPSFWWTEQPLVSSKDSCSLPAVNRRHERN